MQLLIITITKIFPSTFTNPLHNCDCSQHSTYSLSVYGVHSKQQPGYQCWPHCTENHTTQLYIQVAHCTV